MEKLNSAESLRGLACLAVVFSHFFGAFYPQLHSFYVSDLPKFKIAEFIYNSPFAFAYSGTGAVFIFFVLSGYVLTFSFMRSNDSKRKLKESLIKRYPRLAIPALFSCILMWLAFLIPTDLTGFSEWFKSIYLEKPGFYDAVYSGLIGSFIFGDKNYNPVLWTMQIELLGSIIIYFLCFFNNKKIYFYTFLLVSILLSFFISNLVFLGIVSFIFGFYFYFVKHDLSRWLSLLIIVIGLYLCGVHNNSYSYQLFYNLFNNKTYFILNFIGGILIVYSVLKSKWIQDKLDNKFLIKLGELSFSIYLIHLFAMYIIGVRIFHFTFNFTNSFVVSSFICIVTSLVSTYVISLIYSRYVDKLSLRFSNFLVNKTKF